MITPRKLNFLQAGGSTATKIRGISRPCLDCGVPCKFEGKSTRQTAVVGNLRHASPTGEVKPPEWLLEKALVSSVRGSFILFAQHVTSRYPQNRPSFAPSKQSRWIGVIFPTVQVWLCPLRVSLVWWFLLFGVPILRNTKTTGFNASFVVACNL